MQYIVLRDCFTAECQYYKRGDTVELPDEMYKYEKNFKLVEEPEQEIGTPEAPLYVSDKDKKVRVKPKTKKEK